MVIALVAGAIAVLAADIASAQPGSNRPWCIRDGIHGRGMWDCSYYNQRQCIESASGAGGWCTRNPWYQPPKSKSRRKRDE
jgi:hypothetical protein